MTSPRASNRRSTRTIQTRTRGVSSSKITTIHSRFGPILGCRANPLTGSHQASVEAAIKAAVDVEYQGSFVHETTMNAAPNPGLDVQGYGPVGLPLSASVARALIAVCEQAPFGQGERTLVDKEVRDTWQVDAEKVFAQSWIGPFAVLTEFTLILLLGSTKKPRLARVCSKVHRGRLHHTRIQAE
jgi:hypothetical protein